MPSINGKPFFPDVRKIEKLTIKYLSRPTSPDLIGIHGASRNAKMHSSPGMRVFGTAGLNTLVPEVKLG